MPDGAPALRGSGRIGDARLAERLRKETTAEVRFDAFSRGRYATDASIYQIEPIGVVLPRSADDVSAAIAIAREEGVPLIARGGGTSQNGQVLGEALILDTSKHLNRVIEIDAEARTARVQPGLVLARLNAALRKQGLFFPVEPSTASRCTLGGMAGNNSCGARSLVYGKMVDNVQSIDAILPEGEALTFAEVDGNLERASVTPRLLEIAQRLRAIAGREAEEIAARFPKVQRRVGGYNLDSIDPQGPHNLAHLLVGSEGTLALSTELTVSLHPLPVHRVLGVCHFPTFYEAMATTQHLVALGPTAVELVDRNIIELGREITMFRATLDRFVRGEPDSLLLVEFAGEDRDVLTAKLRELDACMADHGFPNAVVEVPEPADQTELWQVREAGLNIMMSMKTSAKPVSFIEDCAVPLENLADYTAGINEIFARHGTSGTWYAHASVGCLHVRPILDMKESGDVVKMREIAEEATDLVKRYKGSHSGEHGDGISRSEFHEKMFGPRLVRSFEAVKDLFDPGNLFNPGKIVRPPRMDDRSLMRFRPGYAPLPLETALDWSEWGGFLGAAEMCNNNGTCRKSSPGAMCPSFRATGDEQHVTRGRANTLRLAITGQLGADAFRSDGMRETMDLCVSCKACKRECPTGVDMAKMKIEFLHHYNERHGLSLKDRLIAAMPRYAPWACRLAPLTNLRDVVPGAPWLSEKLLGLSAKRSLPKWRRDFYRAPFQGTAEDVQGDGRDLVFFADTFNRYMEPETLRDARRVLEAAGYRLHDVSAPGESRPLCCGRTYLASGQVEAARAEARRCLDTLKPFVERGARIVGLEPSCLLTFRDELLSVLPGEESRKLSERAFLLEEFLAAEANADRLDLPLKALPEKKALLHGHCHQKAFAAMGSVETVLRLIPELEVETIESSCCGMAGAFGYEAAHYDVSMRMGELSLLPAVRDASPESLIVADGTSCRHQIADGTGRRAEHVARVLARALSG